MILILLASGAYLYAATATGLCLHFVDQDIFQYIASTTSASVDVENSTKIIHLRAVINY